MNHHLSTSLEQTTAYSTAITGGSCKEDCPLRSFLLGKINDELEYLLQTLSLAEIFGDENILDQIRRIKTLLQAQ